MRNWWYLRERKCRGKTQAVYKMTERAFQANTCRWTKTPWHQIKMTLVSLCDITVYGRSDEEYTFIYSSYILHRLKASACTINEQERGEKRKRGDSVVQSIEGRILWYQAQHFIKYKGTVAAIFILGILGLILIVSTSFIPAYPIEN